jgi:hypothetical protein
MSNAKIYLCERCNHDPVETTDIPDIWVDRYQTLCEHCANEGHKQQSKLDN